MDRNTVSPPTGVERQENNVEPAGNQSVSQNNTQEVSEEGSGQNHDRIDLNMDSSTADTQPLPHETSDPTTERPGQNVEGNGEVMDTTPDMGSPADQSTPPLGT